MATREEQDALIGQLGMQSLILKELADRSDDPVEKREFLETAERMKSKAHEILLERS